MPVSEDSGSGMIAPLTLATSSTCRQAIPSSQNCSTTELVSESPVGAITHAGGGCPSQKHIACAANEEQQQQLARSHTTWG
eukprot:268581-Rhodomonas_salina.1